MNTKKEPCPHPDTYRSLPYLRCTKCGDCVHFDTFTGRWRSVDARTLDDIARDIAAKKAKP